MDAAPRGGPQWPLAVPRTKHEVLPEEMPVEMTWDDHVELDLSAPPACVGDITRDGSVNVGDLLQILDAWGACPAGMACVQDLDDDAQVGVGDLLAVLDAWGPCG